MYDVDLRVSAHPTRSVSARVTRVPSMVVADADRRVRTLDRARTNVANGAMSRNGTAHGSVLAGSNVKPDDLELEAAPDAAARISPAMVRTLSEGPPYPRCQDQAPRVQSRRSPGRLQTPGRRVAARRRRRIARPRRMQLPRRRTSVGLPPAP